MATPGNNNAVLIALSAALKAAGINPPPKNDGNLHDNWTEALGALATSAPATDLPHPPEPHVTESETEKKKRKKREKKARQKENRAKKKRSLSLGITPSAKKSKQNKRSGSKTTSSKILIDTGSDTDHSDTDADDDESRKDLDSELDTVDGDGIKDTEETDISFDDPDALKKLTIQLRAERTLRKDRFDLLIKSMDNDEFWQIEGPKGFDAVVLKLKEAFEDTEDELATVCRNHKRYTKQLEKARQSLEQSDTDSNLQVKQLEKEVSKLKKDLKIKSKDLREVRTKGGNKDHSTRTDSGKSSYVLRQMMNPTFDTLSSFTLDHPTPIGEWIERFKSIVKCIPSEYDHLVLYHLENRLEYETIRLPFQRAVLSGVISSSDTAYSYLIETYSTDDVLENLYKDFVSTAQSKTETVESYSNKRMTLIERINTLGQTLSEFEIMFHFKNGMLAFYREKLEAMPEYSDMSIADIIKKMKALEKAKKTANLSALRAHTDTAHAATEEEPGDIAIQAYLQRNPEWQKKTSKSTFSKKGSKKTPYKRGEFTSVDMKPLYLKDTNGKWSTTGTDTALWDERIKKRREKASPADTPHLYNRDKFNGTPCCIICKNMNHTANTCFRLKDLKTAGKIK